MADYPTTMVLDTMNNQGQAETRTARVESIKPRDRNVSTKTSDEDTLPATLDNRISIASLRKIVAQKAEQYWGKHPGDSDQPSNGYLHSKLQQIEDYRWPYTDRDGLEDALRQLIYRFSVMADANRFVELLGLPKPYGESCEEFNEWKRTELLKRNDEKEYRRLLAIQWSTTGQVSVDDRFQPSKQAGQKFRKGPDYIRFALRQADLNEKDQDLMIEKFRLVLKKGQSGGEGSKESEDENS
jgi:hypothetical protein